MSKIQLNTSVKVIDKSGKETVYDCLESASEATGLSIQALKIRANKNTIPKDKICVEWVDDHTKRSYQSKKSRVKGSKWELDVVHKLNELGFEVKNARGESRSLDNNKIDVYDCANTLPINIQNKCTLNTPNYHSIESECSDKSKPFVICWKPTQKEGKDRKPVAIIPIELLWEFLKLYLKNC